ncbi:hypothetical protein HD806DRAFT_31061 [Xylariaceae sp. AK1471]|nr:hypothetical protein HD806DRAFT_31061 [Xylariaceae sp. AK1471]
MSHNVSFPSDCATPKKLQQAQNMLVALFSPKYVSSSKTVIADASDSTQPSFPQFTRLPLELRDMIWKFALPQAGRSLMILKDYCDRRKRYHRGFLRNRERFKMPLAHVCAESRRVVQEAGYRLYRPQGMPEEFCPGVGVWFCEKRGDDVARNPKLASTLRHVELM